MDAYFDRKWLKKTSRRRLTMLELLDSAARQRFFGGPRGISLAGAEGQQCQTSEEVEGANFPAYLARR